MSVVLKLRLTESHNWWAKVNMSLWCPNYVSLNLTAGGLRINMCVWYSNYVSLDPKTGGLRVTCVYGTQITSH